ncbi:hypothetical protein CTM84_08525 [Photobacterium kishitanii]|nr:hypothetical protein CTM84_08525 [Photobacterium kishitanii]
MFKKIKFVPMAVALSLLPLPTLVQATPLKNNENTLNNVQSNIINMYLKDSITTNNLYDQINNAITTLNKESDNTKLILHLPGGTYYLDNNSHGSKQGIIQIGSAINGTRILEIQGSTNKRNPTKLYANESAYWQSFIFGSYPKNITFSYLSFYRTEKTMSEGIITNVAKGYIDIKLLDGFPEIGRIYNQGMTSGRYLRLISNDINNPTILSVDKGQEPWGMDKQDNPLPPEALDAPQNRNWRIYTKNTQADLSRVGYKIGLWVAVKSKSYNYAYNFQGFSSNITFNNIGFFDSTMGQMHGGAKNITLNHVKFGRGDRVNGVVPAFASSAGGPQFMGYTDSSPYTNILLDYVWLEYTGDDNFSAQHASQGSSFKLDHVTSKGAFARLLLATYDAYGVCLTDNVILDNQPAVVHGAINQDIEHFEFKKQFSVCQY